MSIKQEKYLIAYLDLLGVAEKLINPKIVNKIIQVAYDTVKNANCNMDNHIVPYKAFTFSDNVAFCVPITNARYANELLGLAYMIADFIWVSSGYPAEEDCDGFMTPIRGAITIGDLFIDIDNHFIMGEALARAYWLESKVAKVPRIIIDKDTIDTNICIADNVFGQCEDDDYFFIDFLSCKFSGNQVYSYGFDKMIIKPYVEMIEHEIKECKRKKETEVCLKKKESIESLLIKYRWLAKYCNNFFEKNPKYSDLKIEDSFFLF